MVYVAMALIIRLQVVLSALPFLVSVIFAGKGTSGGSWTLTPTQPRWTHTPTDDQSAHAYVRAHVLAPMGWRSAQIHVGRVDVAMAITMVISINRASK